MTSVVIGIWIVSYVGIDLGMWLAGRGSLVSNLVISIPMMVCGVALTLLLDRMRLGLSRRKVRYAWIALFPGVVCAGAIQCFVDYGSVVFFSGWLYPEWKIYLTPPGVQLVLAVYIYAIHQFLCLIVLSHIRARRTARLFRAGHATALRAHREAEEKALRLQLTPHFLFNALNSIGGLVAQGSNKTADSMICSLSDYLRSTIVSADDADVSLASELAATEAYLEIERLRLGERLVVEFSVAPDAADAAMPGLILQPLAENAVKYGLAAPKSRIRLTIDARRHGEMLVVTVTDRRLSGSADVAADRPAGMGVGLENIRKRLSLFAPVSARLDTEVLDDGFSATLTMPFRRFEERAANRAPTAQGVLEGARSQA